MFLIARGSPIPDNPSYKPFGGLWARTVRHGHSSVEATLVLCKPSLQEIMSISMVLLRAVGIPDKERISYEESRL